MKWINKKDKLPEICRKVLWWNKYTGIETEYLARGLTYGHFDVVTETEGDYAASLNDYSHWAEIKPPA